MQSRSIRRSGQPHVTLHCRMRGLDWDLIRGGGGSCLITWARSTRELAPELLADAGGGIITIMGRDRTQQATSDLFSTASSGDPSPPTNRQRERASTTRSP